MTFSIVAVDRQAREVGFAIASCNWDAGRVCMAQADVGVIASQGSGDQSLLPKYFELLAAGETLPGILAAFQADDPMISKRQLGMVTFAGDAIAYTGEGCMVWAGHRTGSGYTCQGNVLAGPEVVDAMAETFEQADGMLVQRLYAALAAGEAAGGDIRGKQSAALGIKKPGAGGAGSDTFLDFRIEDHDAPVAELGRTLHVAENLLRIDMFQAAVRRAAESEKPAVLGQLRDFLDDKREPRYLDGWLTLASVFSEAGQVDASREALSGILAICPAFRPALQVKLAKGEFPEAWREVLCA